jgi:hypothetical protein
MKSTTAGQNCVQASEMTPLTIAGFGLKCNLDYNGYYDITCADTELVKLNSDNYDFPECVKSKLF